MSPASSLFTWLTAAHDAFILFIHWPSVWLSITAWPPATEWIQPSATQVGGKTRVFIQFHDSPNAHERPDCRISAGVCVWIYTYIWRMSVYISGNYFKYWLWLPVTTHYFQVFISGGSDSKFVACRSCVVVFSARVVIGYCLWTTTSIRFNLSIRLAHVGFLQNETWACTLAKQRLSSTVRTLIPLCTAVIPHGLLSFCHTNDKHANRGILGLNASETLLKCITDAQNLIYDDLQGERSTFFYFSGRDLQLSMTTTTLAAQLLHRIQGEILTKYNVQVWSHQTSLWGHKYKTFSHK